ncbi:MAG: threonine--tRNA ligase, partial [Elusimicrobia bacterium]|nr:threonine--tRNA ligase [Elusimicrobiota bacterium]
MIEINFKNIGKIKIEEGSSIREALARLNRRAADKAIAAELVNGSGKNAEGRVIDLDYAVKKDSVFNIIAPDNNKKAGDILNHSSSHIMAAAIKKIFTDAKFAIGPAIKEGFYYDFETSKNVSAEDLALIEEEMKKLIKADCKFERREISKDEAKKIFKDNAYKIELINEIKDKTVSVYTCGDFTDLCSGPHIPSTGRVGA